jgi:hypothetical protein
MGQKDSEYYSKYQSLFVDMDNGETYWIFDLHMILDLDSLPYDEWVRARDWNKIYQDQINKLLAG